MSLTKLTKDDLIPNDSIFDKDIDIDNSDNGDFSGSVLDYFNSLKTVNANTTSDNPKSIKIWFTRSIQTHSIGFGCDDLTKNFSNIVVKGLGSGEVVRFTNDDYETDNTNRNSLLIKLPPIAVNGFIIEFHTTDTVGLSNLIIFKASDTNSRIQAVSDLTGNVENINSFRGSLNINTGLVHKIGVGRFFNKLSGISSTLSVAASKGDTSITVASATGFNVGDKLQISDDNGGSTITCFEGTEVTILAIVGNVFTIDVSLSNDYTIGTDVKVVQINMNVNGSLTSPITFSIEPFNTGNDLSLWQFTRSLINMTHTAESDDSKFGGILALTNGIVLRTVDGSTGSIRNIVNIKTNEDMKLLMYDLIYTDKAGGGKYGTTGRWTFTKAEFIVELDGRNGDKVELLIQDNLTSLTSFKIRLQGRIFGG